MNHIYFYMNFQLSLGRDLGIYRPSVKKIDSHGKDEYSPYFNKGDKVIFFPSCTCEGCKMVEQWYLKRGAIFTVKEIQNKDGWATIEVEEVPEKFFASMMFLKKND